MERETDSIPQDKNEPQPLGIELIPNHNRTTIIICMNSNAPIPSQMCMQALESFVGQMKKKLAEQSKIQKVTPQIVVP